MLSLKTLQRLSEEILVLTTLVQQSPGHWALGSSDSDPHTSASAALTRGGAGREGAPPPTDCREGVREERDIKMIVKVEKVSSK